MSVSPSVVVSSSVVLHVVVVSSSSEPVVVVRYRGCCGRCCCLLLRAATGLTGIAGIRGDGISSSSDANPKGKWRGPVIAGLASTTAEPERRPRSPPFQAFSGGGCGGLGPALGQFMGPRSARYFA